MTRDIQSLEGFKVLKVEEVKGTGANVFGTIDEDLAEVVLTGENGKKVSLYLEAECCSNSYFTDVKQFDELIGATIRKAEERENDNANEDAPPETRWHFLVLETDKGHVTIDWRNDSNGYYDGWVVVRDPK